MTWSMMQGERLTPLKRLKMTSFHPNYMRQVEDRLARFLDILEDEKTSASDRQRVALMYIKNRSVYDQFMSDAEIKTDIQKRKQMVGRYFKYIGHAETHLKDDDVLIALSVGEAARTLEVAAWSSDFSVHYLPVYVCHIDDLQDILSTSAK